MSVKPYRPSNGEEGRIFQAAYCDRCVHDHNAHLGNFEDGCRILASTLGMKVTDPDYPKEWVIDRDSDDEDLRQGTCTAFEAEKGCNNDPA